MKKICLYTVGLALISLSNFSTMAQENDLITTVKDAVPITKKAPKYPVSQARIAAEGWADLSYIIEPDGSVSNVIVENSSGRRQFEKSAIAAVKSWKYQPATENGKPIQQCKNTVRMSFAMSDVKYGISRKFRNKYVAAEKLLDQRKIEQAKEALESLEKLKKYRLAEDRYLSILKNRYAKLTHNPVMQLQALKAFSYDFNDKQNNKDDRKENDLQFSLLYEKLSVQLTLNLLQGALDTLSHIEKNPSSAPYIGKLSKIKTQIIKVIDDDKPLVVIGNTGDKALWTHQLARHNFSFSNVNGQIQQIDIRCNNQRHIYRFEDKKEWKIPNTWNKCNLYILGNKNTTFKLIELNEEITKI